MSGESPYEQRRDELLSTIEIVKPTKLTCPSFCDSRFGCTLERGIIWCNAPTYDVLPLRTTTTQSPATTVPPMPTSKPWPTSTVVSPTKTSSHPESGRPDESSSLYIFLVPIAFLALLIIAVTVYIVIKRNRRRHRHSRPTHSSHNA